MITVLLALLIWITIVGVAVALLLLAARLFDLWYKGDD